MKPKNILFLLIISHFTNTIPSWVSIFFVKYRNIDIETLIRRHIYLPLRYSKIQTVVKALKVTLCQSPRVTQCNPESVPTFASSIPLVVFNLVKIVKHQ